MISSFRSASDTAIMPLSSAMYSRDGSLRSFGAGLSRSYADTFTAAPAMGAPLSASTTVSVNSFGAPVAGEDDQSTKRAAIAQGDNSRRTTGIAYTSGNRLPFGVTVNA